MKTLHLQSPQKGFFNFMPNAPLILALIILISSIPLFAQAPDTLYILQTTDVHGHIYPYNYYTDKPAGYGLAKAYTKICEYRKKHKNVLLIDSGDLLQGTPLAYYYDKINATALNPLILTLNYMGYDAFTVGNHDIEQGFPVYYRAMRLSAFPWLSANAVLPDGRSFFEPYAKFNLNGIKIVVLGLTTPAIPMWLDSTLYPGIRWTDMIKTAAYWAPRLRQNADVLVGSFHSGFEAEYSKKQTDRLGLPNENASLLVAKEVPEFDIVFGGHSHRPLGRRGFNASHADPIKNLLIQKKHRTLLLNAGSWAKYLGVAQIILQKEKNGTYRITGMDGWLEPLKDVPPSPAILTLIQPYHNETLKYTHTPIATLTDTLSALNARWQDTAFMDLINKAQMKWGHADISFAACFNDKAVIPPGKMRIKDVYQMYKYENYLYVLKMSGQQIKDFLEYCARYYQWKDGKLTANPQMAGYNYDMAEGIAYEIHVKNPVGQRIKRLIDLKTGKPLNLKKIYKVAMNSYRATGGGGHLAAAHASNAPIIWKSDREIRNLLIDYLKEMKIIKPTCNQNWKLVY